MAGNTFDFEHIVARDPLAKAVSNRWVEWEQARQKWLDEKNEARKYLQATSTRSTTNNKLPWKNSTTRPKLTQIYDNLVANYTAVLFPKRDWLNWENLDPVDEELEEKREAILGLMQGKIESSDFRKTVRSAVGTFVEFGDTYGQVEWVDERFEDPVTGKKVDGYVGPKLFRINPLDIVFNITANDFRDSPKIVRSLISLGELKEKIEKDGRGSEEAQQIADESFGKAVRTRKALSSFTPGDKVKNDNFQINGFGDLANYYQSGMVEVLTLYGDIYDEDKDEMLLNHKVVIVDRSHVISKEPIDPIYGKDVIIKAGWRERSDNLISMGPLDNLVGIQYRIDHVENLKADAFDLTVFPIKKVTGLVDDDLSWAPGAEWQVGDSGDVELVRLQPEIFTANTEIQEYERSMEEMAGAPREALGIRSPGEKTKFEVQQLNSAASRMFQDKISQFERNFLEKALNQMLRLTQKNMTETELVKTFVSENGAETFRSITKEDIATEGRLKPMGATAFAKKAQLLQDLTSMSNTGLLQDPEIKQHFSSKRLARMIEELLDAEKYEMVQDFSRIDERAEADQLASVAQEQVDVASSVPAGVFPGDEDTELDEEALDQITGAPTEEEVQ